MELRLRQPVLVARNKDETVATLKTVFGLVPVHGSGDLSAYDLPQWGPMSDGGRKILAQLGVENLIFAVGSDFIEVMFPTRDDGTTVAFMDRRGGDTGYMIVLQTDDVGHYEARARDEGVRISHKAAFVHYEDIHLHPRDCGGALLSMAKHLPYNVAGGAWYPAGMAWQGMPQSAAVSAVVGVELLSPDAQALAARWGRLLGKSVERNGDQWIIRIDDAVLRFGPTSSDQKEGFYGLDLKVADRARIEQGVREAGLAIKGDKLTVCGMTVRLVA